jgi:hypothetical protein
LEEQSTQERVLLVHGTFSNVAQPADSPKPWWIANSPFCSQLDAALAKHGSKARTGTDHDVFAWSGANSESERRKAAAELAARLRIFDQDPRISRYHLIAHSHGGNVVVQALQSFQPQHLGAVIFLGTPYLEFRDRKPRFTPRRVALMVYWLGLGASAAGVWRERGILSWSLLVTFVVCLLLSWPRKPASKNKQPFRFPFLVNIPRSAIYGNGVPYAFAFRADEAINLFRHVAKLAKEPHETFNSWFSSSKESTPFIRPTQTVSRPTLRDEMNELPHAFLLRAIWNKNSASPVPSVPPTPDSWGYSETAGLIWSLLNSYPPVQALGVAVLVVIYLLVIVPFLLFAAWREFCSAVVGLLGSWLRKLLWQIGPRVTSQYLLHKTFGLDTGNFHCFQEFPPEVQEPQPISPELEKKMSELAQSAGGWAGSAFSGSLADPETSHIRTRFEELFDNPGLAHTQYYQEPEIIEAIATLITKASTAGLTSFMSPLAGIAALNQ